MKRRLVILLITVVYVITFAYLYNDILDRQYSKENEVISPTESILTSVPFSLFPKINLFRFPSRDLGNKEEELDDVEGERIKIEEKQSQGAQEVPTQNDNTGDRTEWPFRNLIIKITPDDKIIAQGLLLVQSIKDLPQGGESFLGSLQSFLDAFRITRDLSFYVKGSGSIENNNVNLSIDSLGIGGLPLPRTLFQHMIPKLKSAIENRLISDGYNVEQILIKDGKLIRQGDLPDVMEQFINDFFESR
jgi:hypothetical protein